MTVGLEPDQVEDEVEKRLRDFARSATMPGFRPGKVPIKVLRRRFGEKIRREAFGELVISSFSEAVTQEGLQPVGEPEIEPDIDESARRYTYTALFEVLPRIELGSLDGKTLKRPVAEVTDADLDTILMRLRKQRKTWSVVERPAQLEDRLKISFTGTLDGEPFEGGSGEDVELELGLGRLIPGFEEGLVGALAGDERQLDLNFPDQYPPEHLRGKPVSFTVQVSEVAEPMLPEVDAAFAADLGFPDGDLDQFHRDLRRNMERELKSWIHAKVKQQVMDLLFETNRIDLPEIFVLKEIETLKQQARQRVPGGGFELPTELFRDQAERRVALGLILGEVVKTNHIELDPQRVRQAVEDFASTYQNPQEAIDYCYADKERLAPMESLALEDQVVDWVLDCVTVVDEPSSFEALSGPAAVG